MLYCFTKLVKLHCKNSSLAFNKTTIFNAHKIYNVHFANLFLEKINEHIHNICVLYLLFDSQF